MSPVVHCLILRELDLYSLMPVLAVGFGINSGSACGGLINEIRTHTAIPVALCV